MIFTHRFFVSLIACAFLFGCSKNADKQAAAPAVADSGTTSAGNAGSPSTVTSFSTITAVSTVTETATVTNTQVQTVTETRVSTITATVANTATVTAVRTVTATQTNTVTVTATATDVDVKPIFGKFESEECFLNRPASDGFGRKIFTRSTLRLNKNGRGRDLYVLFEDEGCEKEILRGKAAIRFKISRRIDSLYVIAVEQFNDPKNHEDITRYWIPGLPKKNGWLLDVDYARGAPGPFLLEPSDSELKEVMESIEKRGLLFEKK